MPLVNRSYYKVCTLLVQISYHYFFVLCTHKKYIFNDIYIIMNRLVHSNLFSTHNSLLHVYLELVEEDRAVCDLVFQYLFKFSPREEDDIPK